MNFYSGKHRQNLADDTDINELEKTREGQVENPEDSISAEVQEIAPNPDTLPAPTNVEEETFKKRYSDLRRHMAAKEKEWQVKFDELTRRIEAMGQKQLELPGTDNQDEVARWMAEYPDVARIVTKIAETQAEKQNVDVRKQLDEIAKDKRRNARERAEIELRKMHSDIDELRNSEDFHTWVDQQPALIRAALYENDTDWKAAGRAIDLYKADKALLDAPKRGRPKKEEFEASAPVVVKTAVEPSAGSNKRTWKESEISKLKAHEFERFEDDIMAARREGRIVYDLSQKMASM